MNKLYFTANLREPDLYSLIVSLSLLTRAKTVAEDVFHLKTRLALEDYSRIVIVDIPTRLLSSFASIVKVFDVPLGEAEVYDREALELAVSLGFAVDDMTGEDEEEQA